MMDLGFLSPSSYLFFIILLIFLLFFPCTLSFFFLLLPGVFKMELGMAASSVGVVVIPAVQGFPTLGVLKMVATVNSRERTQCVSGFGGGSRRASLGTGGGLGAAICWHLFFFCAWKFCYDVGILLSFA